VRQAASMSKEDAIEEWNSKSRRSGCASAAQWFCDRVPGYKPMRLKRQTEQGYWEHVVAMSGDGDIVDLTPHLDSPDPESPTWKTTPTKPKGI
jgi:hypothetical protein